MAVPTATRILITAHMSARVHAAGGFDHRHRKTRSSMHGKVEGDQIHVAQGVQRKFFHGEVGAGDPEALGINSAPALIKDSGLPLVFDKMAVELLANGGSFAIEKKISDLFATMACHSVVRAGQSLSILQMQELLKSMDQFALSSFCPHGRPVSVEKSFMELEKLFGRIN